MSDMTARSTNPVSQARSAKREDTTPKKHVVTGTNRDGQKGVAAARSRGIDTSSKAGAAQISPDKPLTEKQRLFVKFWAEGETIKTASLKAGYSDGAQMAYRMVYMPNVLALKAQLSAKYEEEAQMTRKKVMDMHMEAYEMSKLMAEPATMVAAAREIGKLCNYYAPVEHRVKVDITGNIILDRMNSLSDAELLKVISADVQKSMPILEDFSEE